MEDIIKHYELDSGASSKLVEIWKHYNPKDEPTINDDGSIFLNQKNKSVSPHQLVHVLIGMMTHNKMYWHNRFYIQCFQLRSQDIMKFLEEIWLRSKSGYADPIKRRVSEEPEGAKPEKPPRKPAVKR